MSTVEEAVASNTQNPPPAQDSSGETEKKKKTPRCDVHARNRFIAKLIPAALILIVGYATWVYIVEFCSNILPWLQQAKISLLDVTIPRP
jgi:hypothetical protein